MIFRALLYCVGVFVLLVLISLFVAWIITILYKIMHRGENKKVVDNTGAKPVAQ